MLNFISNDIKWFENLENIFFYSSEISLILLKVFDKIKRLKSVSSIRSNWVEVDGWRFILFGRIEISLFWAIDWLVSWLSCASWAV